MPIRMKKEKKLNNFITDYFREECKKEVIKYAVISGIAGIVIGAFLMDGKK